MAFKLGDVIVDRLQFGYGAKSNGTPLYALTQLTQANIDVYKRQNYNFYIRSV